MPHYPNHGRSTRQSPTGGDSGSWYSEPGRTILPPLTVAFPTSDPPESNNYPSTYPTTQRSTPLPYETPYYHPAQQQQQQHHHQHQHRQTLQPNVVAFPAHQQLSEATYLSSQTHGSSYNRASPASNSADRWPPPLNVPEGGRWQGQGQSYYHHADLQIPPASSEMRSPHSVYSPTSFPQYQPTSPAYPAGHSPSRGPVPTVAAPHAHYHQSMAMSHASLERNMPTSRGAAQLPYARAPPPPSPVPFDIPAETPEPTIKKKRKRADARQLEALNRMYNRTAFPSTEERLALAKELDMSARSVQIWFQNKRQSSRQGGRNPANPGPPVDHGTATLPPGTQPFTIHPRASPSPMSPMGEVSRSPMPVMMRSGQTPSPPSGRSRADIDPRRHWPGPSRGY